MEKNNYFNQATKKTGFMSFLKSFVLKEERRSTANVATAKTILDTLISKVVLKMAFIAVLFWGQVGFGQTVIASDGLNNNTSFFTLSGGAYYNNSSASGDRPATSPFFSEGTHSRGVSNSSAVLTSNSNLNTTNYNNVTMTFRLAAFSIGSTGNGLDSSDPVTIEVSPDGGATYYSTLVVNGNSNCYWAYTTGTGIASTAYDGNATPVTFQPAGGGSRTTDGYSTITITDLPSVTSLRFKITLLNNSTSERWVMDDFKITGTPSATPTIVLSDNGTQIVTGNVIQGTSNHILSSFKYAVTDANATLSQASFQVNGNYSSSDISNFKLWYNSSNSFAGATSLGSKSSTSSGSGDNLTFTSLSQAVNTGSTGYFWITTTIAPAATVGETVNVAAIPNANLVFASGNKSGSATAAGLQTIIADTTPKFVIESISNIGFGNTCLTTTSVTTGSFDLYGYYLTGNATVGPLAGYTFSNDNSTFNNQLTLTPSSGELLETIYIKFTPTLVQSYNGNISISGGSATTANVAVTGAGINTSPSITTPTSASITASSATLGGNIAVSGCNPITERGIYYSTTSGFADGTGTKVSETGTFSTGVFTVNTTGITANTTYYYKAFATSTSGTGYSTQGSFTTSCGAANIPFTQNFESVSIPSLPNCSSLQNLSGNDWTTSSVNANGFDSKVLKYQYNISNPANSWYYTQGINLISGTAYTISYKYGNNSSFIEKLKVAFGTSTVNSAMVNEIANYASITGGSASTASVTFVAPSTGVFYFGFNAYSNEDQYNLYVDDIYIEQAPTCVAPTIDAATNLTATTATLNWTAPSSAPSEGYDYYYSTSDVAPTGSTTPTGSVGTGIVTANLTGLTSSTAYYYWIRSNCDLEDVSLWVSGGDFTTTVISAPVATAATDITSTGFTANWNAVAGATSYNLDIYQETVSNAPNLFISEYGEGSGGNKKYIEIYNGTGGSVDLSNYQIWNTSNGGEWSVNSTSLSSITLLNNATFVLANNDNDVFGADLYSTAISFNGDDAIGIAWNGGSGSTFTLLDAVGEDGPDPGSGWNVAGTNNATADKILIRKSSISSPNNDWDSARGTTESDSEWLVSSFTYNNTNQTTTLGSHTFDGGTSTTL